MLPILVITYVIYEQLERIESPKIKNEMYKMLTAAVLPDSAMQGNIIIRLHTENGSQQYHRGRTTRN